MPLTIWTRSWLQFKLLYIIITFNLYRFLVFFYKWLNWQTKNLVNRSRKWLPRCNPWNWISSNWCNLEFLSCRISKPGHKSRQSPLWEITWILVDILTFSAFNCYFLHVTSFLMAAFITSLIKFLQNCSILLWFCLLNSRNLFKNKS